MTSRLRPIGNFLAGAVLLAVPAASCGTADPVEVEPQGEWLAGDSQERLQTIERQFRGFDMAMIEVGYRFAELYFAGQDRNWPYARYQIEKMELAIELGLERRPKRAASARPFLQQDLPKIPEAVEKEDQSLFMENIELLRSGCMRCHIQEEVPHFTVQMPETRQSVVKLGP